MRMFDRRKQKFEKELNLNRDDIAQLIAKIESKGADTVSLPKDLGAQAALIRSKQAPVVINVHYRKTVIKQQTYGIIKS